MKWSFVSRHTHEKIVSELQIELEYYRKVLFLLHRRELLPYKVNVEVSAKSDPDIPKLSKNDLFKILREVHPSVTGAECKEAWEAMPDDLKVSETKKNRAHRKTGIL